MAWKRIIILYIVVGFLTFGWADHYKCNEDQGCAMVWGVAWPVALLGSFSLYVTNPANWPSMPTVTFKKE